MCQNHSARANAPVAQSTCTPCVEPRLEGSAQAMSGAPISAMIMCCVTRAENSATPRLQSGEISAASTTDHPPRLAAIRRSDCGSLRIVRIWHPANARSAKIRTGSRFHASEPGTGGGPQYGMYPAAIELAAAASGAGGLACSGGTAGGSLGPRSLAGGARPLGPAATLGRPLGLPGERFMRGRASRLALQHARDRARHARAATRLPLALPDLISIPGAFARARLRLALLRRPKRHACAARLRKADRDRLLRRARAMLALANLVDLFPDELACLRARRLPFSPVASRFLDGFFLRHCQSPAPESFFQTAVPRSSSNAGGAAGRHHPIGGTGSVTGRRNRIRPCAVSILPHLR